MIGDLWPDAPPTVDDLPVYFQQMEHLSETLRLWWRDPAREAQNLMNSLGRDVRFSAISSIGHQPLWERAGERFAQAIAGDAARVLKILRHAGPSA